MPLYYTLIDYARVLYFYNVAYTEDWSSSEALQWDESGSDQLNHMLTSWLMQASRWNSYPTSRCAVQSTTLASA